MSAQAHATGLLKFHKRQSRLIRQGVCAYGQDEDPRAREVRHQPKGYHHVQERTCQNRMTGKRQGASSAGNTRGETARKRAGRQPRVDAKIGSRQGAVREGRRLLRRPCKARSRRSGETPAGKLKAALQKASAAGVPKVTACIRRQSRGPRLCFIQIRKKGAGEPLSGALRRCGRGSSQNGQSASHSGSITTLMKLAARAMFASSKSSAIMPGTEWTIRSMRSCGSAL